MPLANAFGRPMAGSGGINFLPASGEILKLNFYWKLEFYLNESHRIKLKLE